MVFAIRFPKIFRKVVCTTMKKAILLCFVMVMVGGTAVFAANQHESLTLINSHGYTDSVVGQHAYGRWEVKVIEGSSAAIGELEEKCQGDSEWTVKEILTADAAQDYYMSGYCEYRVHLIGSSEEGHISRADIWNYKP